MRIYHEQIHTKGNVWVFFIQKENNSGWKHRDKVKDTEQSKCVDKSKWMLTMWNSNNNSIFWGEICKELKYMTVTVHTHTQTHEGGIGKKSKWTSLR